MSTINYEKWYFSRLNSIIDLKLIFSGLGTLLIDGDALFDLNYEPVDFTKKLNSCGFDSIKIVFFHENYSIYTQKDSFHNLCLKENINNVNPHDFIIFDQWTEQDRKWSSFVNDENISLLLTSDLRKEKSFKFIHDMCVLNSFQVCLLNHFEFHYAEIKTFLVQGHTEYITNGQQNDQITMKPMGSSKTLSLSQNERNDEFCDEEIKSKLNSNYFQISNNKIIDLDKFMQSCLSISSTEDKIITSKVDTSSSLSEEDDESWETKYDNLIDEKKVDDNHDNAKEYHEGLIMPIGQAKNDFKPTKETWHIEVSTKFDKRRIIKSNNLNNVQRNDNKCFRRKQSESEYLNKLPEEKWDFKVPTKRKPRKSSLQYQLEHKQKYYRYLQSYSDSLNESKCLHHTIIVGEKEYQPVKRSLNEQKLLQQKESNARKLQDNLEKEKVDKFIEEIRSYVEQFKVSEISNSLEVKKSLYHQIIELINEYKLKLNEEQWSYLMNLLKQIGFESTSAYLSPQLGFNLQASFKHDLEFQLEHFDEHLQRTVDSVNDERVLFKPDKWQERLLDIVDRHESAVISAPTGTGKTFICYYAMEKILRANNSDLIVFVAPMKALANQVTAEVYARFGYKQYPNNSKVKTVFAMYMPDYVINDPFNCQILITVPQMLETILSQDNEEFIKRIRYIILDEIQTINDHELGECLERIIHFARCPLIAMSAVMRNLESFYTWLRDISKSNGIEMHKIVYNERYCNLQKFVFAEHAKLVKLNELYGYSRNYLKSNNYSEEFNLLGEEIIEILNALSNLNLNDEQKLLVEEIKPEKYFKTPIITRNDVKSYEKLITSKLREWIINDTFSESQFKIFFDTINQRVNCLKWQTNEKWVLKNIYDLISELHKNKMTPCIIFCKSSRFCDQLAKQLVEKLIEKERKERKIDKKAEEKAKKLNKILKRQRDNDQENDSFIPQEEFCTIDDTIPDSCTFFDPKYRPTESTLDEEILLHKHRNIPKVMFDAWKHGIGVHHANYHTKYRSSVECLFRKRYLQVVFATETLSLGINMPCKTVVLTCDSITFDPILHRQMTGRAGRRGFDKRGNVVYFGVPEKKIKNFILSKIENISGRYTFTSCLILQMVAMKHYKPNINSIIESFLQNPIIKLNSEYNVDRQKEYFQLQLSYLAHRGFINYQDFSLNRKIDLILPLRHEKVAYFEIAELLTTTNYFDDLIKKYINEDDRCYRFILSLCHFIHLKPVSVSHSLVYSSSREKNIVLDEISDLKEFIKQRNVYLETIMHEQAFTFTHSGLLLPKNSYLFDYMVEAKLRQIESVNLVTETSLWYALKCFRLVLICINRYLAFDIGRDEVKKVFQECENLVTERFKSIVN